jgi:hypothetical protein
VRDLTDGCFLDMKDSHTALADFSGCLHGDAFPPGPHPGQTSLLPHRGDILVSRSRSSCYDPGRTVEVCHSSNSVFISHANRSGRFPPAFAEFPTDADYAIEIIGQRMARGESVVPLKKKKEKKISSASPGASTIPLLDEGSRTVTSSSFSSASDSGEKSSKKGFSWTKLTTNAMQAASWVDQGIKLVSSKDTGRLGNFSPSSTSGAQSV